ncbi:GAF domain-containing protein [Trypanosoma grayi]|uniref:GAF domain-containing protein n=1 Tax=Trypanosoma grayi TaxID=71804 RepID=UPI0004F415A8|nr:GAF domain-containing protein [Trypanosoma grayi]KEG12326.1 GAF domain-containing protein [Trypanosoma grayi]
METQDSPGPVYNNKEELYAHLALQVEGFADLPNRKVVPNTNTMIVLSNVAALLFYELNRHANPSAMLQQLPVNWLGFYLLQSPQLLVLGPFQGRPACTEIKLGRGVCGKAAQEGETLIVADVHEFTSHIACDSFSNSEIVIPIKTTEGHVVGLIDVDSTQLGFFDEVDSEGLQTIAKILSQHLEFPMGRVLSMNPMLANVALHNAKATPTAAASDIRSGGTMTVQSLPRPPGTKIAAAVLSPASSSTTVLTPLTEVPALSKEPQRRVKEVSGWEFTVTELSRILTQDEMRQYEEEIGISAIPEIQFAFNTLSITPVVRDGAPLITFSLKEMLRSAAEFYRTDAYRLKIAPQLTIPVAESWKHTSFATFDPKVDWAWRNNYFGVDTKRCTLKSLVPSMPGVNWDLLKDQSLPILFFHNFDIMEDDLHDHGVVTSSVRVRVMPQAFFILYRHFIRVDGYRVWMRDVRLYNEYAVRRPDGQPHIVIREELRMLDLDDSDEWRELTPDEYAQRANVVEVNDFFVDFDATSDHTWWHSIGVTQR